MLHKNSTFGDYVTTDYYVSSGQLGGKQYEVQDLTLTVYDMSGNPIEDATVLVYQNEGKETWNFNTNSSGQIKDCHGDDPVFVRRQIISTTPTYADWSDSISSGRYHSIVIMKEGYQVWQRKIEFVEDHIINVYLQAGSGARMLSQD